MDVLISILASLGITDPVLVALALAGVPILGFWVLAVALDLKHR